MKVLWSALILSLSWCGASCAQQKPSEKAFARSEWKMSLLPDATVSISHRGAPVVEAKWIFWGAGWKWLGADFSTGAKAAAGTAYAGAVPDLKLKFSGTVTNPQPNVLQFRYLMDAAEGVQNITGGGLEWSLKTDAPSLRGQSSEPQMLPDNAGWTWPVANGQAVTVKFEPPPASVYFERGNKNQIRAMFAAGNLTAGRREGLMTVQLPACAQLQKSPSERYGATDMASLIPDAMRWDVAPVDLSFLNHKPAGRHGFVKAQGDRLVFADGTPARFWGGNIAAYALFSDKDAIQQQAKRMAQLGYNLMRLHHHDSMAWVEPTVIDKKRDDSQQLDAAAMDKIDWLIKCLKDEGIYVWLDLHVGRQFKSGDAIPGFAELQKQNGEGKGFNYFNPRVRDLMNDFATKYLNHVNAYTGLAYKADPAVMGLLLTNENDVTHHFGNLMLGDKGNPHHNALFHQQSQAFAAQHGLPQETIGRTWEAGPSKIFLNHKEHEWNANALAHLKQLGVQVPVATTNFWGGEALWSLPALTDGSIIDAHSYGENEALSKNPRYDANFISWIGCAQVANKPLAITEWNVEYPTTDRFTAPLYMASISALQGWDAPMIYNYSQRPFSAPDREDKWSTFFDPALQAMMPAAALIFRRGDVREAQSTYHLQLSREALYLSQLSPSHSATLRTLVEQSRLTIGLPQTSELPWLQSGTTAGAKVLSDVDKDFIPANRNYVLSDTGELSRDWERGIHKIDTPKTQSVSGWIGGETLATKDVSFGMTTPKAAVALSSLDNLPLGQSKQILISVAARVQASAGAKMPYLSEPVAGTLTLRSNAGKLQLSPLKSDGTQGQAVALSGNNQSYRITLPGTSHWYLLRAD
ncbi:MAG: hypothetical protein JWN98_662 [Abditibacteriota bacterium]|nr:hypothetical protein [Abditibacteriota bacterium]